jgi:hypothetical protein
MGGVEKKRIIKTVFRELNQFVVFLVGLLYICPSVISVFIIIIVSLSLLYMMPHRWFRGLGLFDIDG